MTTQPDPVGPEMATMKEALTAAIAGGRWLTAADSAALQLAYFLAEQIDRDRDTNDERLFLQILCELGFTTKSRRGENPEQPQTPLDILRKKASRIPNATTRSKVQYK